MKKAMFEIVSQCDKFDIDKAIEYIKLNEKRFRDYAYIIHDKDVDKDGNPKKPHYHLYVRMHNKYDFKYVAQWFNIPENFISDIKGHWVDALKYAIHQNAPDKYQYDVEDVISNFDFEKDLKKASAESRKLEIVQDIIDGNIKEYNYFEYMTAYEYVMYSSAMEKAYKYRVDALNNLSREMKCIYITGGSGLGKTTLAKMIAKSNNYSVFISSCSNDILDGYKGQECIILDDIRSSCMKMDMLLKMLDNNTASTISSRYRNKVLECKLIIITTTKTLTEFFKAVYDNEDEDIIQLQRRCETLITMKKDVLEIKTWLKKSRTYSDVIKAVNPVANLYEVEDNTLEERTQFITDTLKCVEIIEDDTVKNSSILDDIKKDEETTGVSTSTKKGRHFSGKVLPLEKKFLKHLEQGQSSDDCRCKKTLCSDAKIKKIYTQIGFDGIEPNTEN